MGLKILTHDELPRGAEPQVLLQQHNAFWGFSDFDAQARWRRAGANFADYFAVYAVEREQVLSKVVVFRFPFTTRRGTVKAAGIASVTTRPDAGSRGLARLLIEDAHRREREDGAQLALLYTNRSWYAHTLYEKLGYRDVWQPFRALRLIGGIPDGFPGRARVRAGRISDVKAIEALHARATRGQHGFTPRPSRWLKSRLSAEHLKPADIGVATERGRITGFTVFHGGRNRMECWEFLSTSPASRDALLRWLEKKAQGKWLLFGGSFPSAERETLSGRGYEILPGGWTALMAAALEPGWPSDPEGMKREVGGDDPRFSSQSFDGF
jgi:predicted acetyltransferase